MGADAATDGTVAGHRIPQTETLCLAPLLLPRLAHRRALQGCFPVHSSPSGCWAMKNWHGQQPGSHKEKSPSTVRCPSIIQFAHLGSSQPLSALPGGRRGASSPQKTVLSTFWPLRPPSISSEQSQSAALRDLPWRDDGRAWMPPAHTLGAGWCLLCHFLFCVDAESKDG